MVTNAPPGSVSRIFRSSFPDLADPGFRSAAWRVPITSKAMGAPVETLHPTLLHALQSAAKLGDKVGITLIPEDEDGETETRSFKRLWQDVKTMSVALTARGVLRGDRVLLVMPTSFEMLISFFAVQRIGAIPVPSYPPAALEKVETGLDRLAHIGNHARVAWCVTLRSLRPVLGDLGHRVSSLRGMLAADKLMREPLDDDDRASVTFPVALRALPEDPALIQYTSGSTGDPKGVLLSHYNMVTNLHVSGQGVEITRNEVVASWLPLYHDMGLISVLYAVYWRIRLVLMSPTAFLMRPSRWLWVVSDHRATISAAPNFAFGLCTKRIRPSDIEGLDLSSWRIVMNGAEPVNAKTVEAFIAKFSPYGFKREAMYPVYGLAENVVATAFPRPGEPMRTVSVDRSALADGNVVAAEGDAATVLTCVGRAVPNHEVVVADENGDELSDGFVGHILVRGPSVMRGYYRDPEATARVLRDGWLWTGDLGFVGEGGLYITGRAKDLIILRGKNYYAEDVERVVETVDGVRLGGVVAFAVYDDEQARDVVIVVCETRERTKEEEATMAETIIEAVAQQCGLTIDEVVFVSAGTIPKTSSGKRQRSLARQRYLSDTLVPQRTGRLQLASVFARSAAGLLRLMGRQMTTRREPP